MSRATRRTSLIAINCAPRHGLFSWGVSLMRQLPSPSAAAWLFDLGDLRGPWIVVLRDHEEEARERLAEHLVELGQSPDIPTALAVVADVAVDHAGVIW